MIHDLQARMPSHGSLSIGATRQTRSGRTAPMALDTFRVATTNEDLARAVAAAHGGEVTDWVSQATGGHGFQVVTNADRLPILVPQCRIEPWYEQWGKGRGTATLLHRCDGITDFTGQVGGRPCSCDPEDRGCQPTMRLSVALHCWPTAGLKVVTGSWNSIAELSGLAGIIAGIPAGQMLPGFIAVEFRETSRIGRSGGVESRRFPVIGLEFPELARAKGAGAALGSGQVGAALGAVPEPDPRQAADADELVVRRAIDDCGSYEDLRELWSATDPSGREACHTAFAAAGLRVQQPSGHCPAPIRIEPGPRPDSARTAPGPRPDPTRTVSGPTPDSVRTNPGQCPDSVRTVSGQPDQPAAQTGTATDKTPAQGVSGQGEVVSGQVVGPSPNRTAALTGYLAAAGQRGMGRAAAERHLTTATGRGFTTATVDDLTRAAQGLQTG